MSVWGMKVFNRKKKQVAPTIDAENHKFISLLSRICDEAPDKTICEMVLIEGIKSRAVMDAVSVHFVDEYQHGNKTYFGDMAKEPYRFRASGKTRRAFMRLDDEQMLHLRAVKRALDCSEAAAAGLILTTAIRYREVVSRVVSYYVLQDLDARPKTQISQMLRKINRHHRGPEKITATILANYLVAQCIRERKGIKEVVWSYLERV